MILDAIKRAFARCASEKRPMTYWVIDMHDVVINTTAASRDAEYTSEHVVPVLQHLTEREDVTLIMWTRSGERLADYYRRAMEMDDIFFDYVNENPERFNADPGFGRIEKMYASVLLDDKAGFNAHEDWLTIRTYFGI